MSNHPLYIEENKTYRSIQLYPPRKCTYCDHVGYDVEWKEVEHMTGGIFFTKDTKTKTECKKLCRKCYLLEIQQGSWE